MIELVETLAEVLEPYTGQTVFCEADGLAYRWDPVAGWEQTEIDAGLNMNMYDINKQIIGQLPDMDNDTINEKKKLIRDFVSEQHNQFYMLLCRDINYYTLFAIDKKNADECIEDVTIECINDIGVIKSIDLNENGAIEIWITQGDSIYVAYFFGYDLGVIVCA